MKAFYSHFEISSMLDETGDDSNLFHIYFKKEDQSIVYMPFIVNYERFHRYLNTKDNEAYEYLRKIRSNIRGFGPKHSKVFEVFTNEGFDLEKYIKMYFEDIEPNDIKDQIEYSERLEQSKQMQTQAKEAFEKLQSLMDNNMRVRNIHFDKFRVTVDEKLHEVVFKFYPELFDQDQEVIEKYKKALVNATLTFTSDIDKIVAYL